MKYENSFKCYTVAKDEIEMGMRYSYIYNLVFVEPLILFLLKHCNLHKTIYRYLRLQYNIRTIEISHLFNNFNLTVTHLDALYFYEFIGLNLERACAEAIENKLLFPS